MFESVECLRDGPLWLRLWHALSDGGIFIAYFVIPVVLVWIYRSMKARPEARLLYQFGAFIVLCGLTHLMSIITLQWPIYITAATLKTATAIVSLSVMIEVFRRRHQIVRLGAMAADLTRAKDKAEMESTHMRDFLEAAPDAMLIVGADGIIELVNAEAERLFGYGRDELVGMRVEDLVPEGRRGRHEEYRQEYAKAPRVRTMGETANIEGRRKDGSTFAADVKLSPFGVSVIAAVRDVTARREADRERDLLITRLEAMGRTIVEMSTPVIEIEDGVLLLPIVGTFDSARVLQIVEQASATVSARGSEVVIVDVTGVPVMDSGVVDAFIRLAQVLSLLGARCILTGIRGAVAQTMVEQGVAISGFVTKATLRAGIKEARSLARKP